jgi:hypothetical protein
MKCIPSNTLTTNRAAKARTFNSSDIKTIAAAIHKPMTMAVLAVAVASPTHGDAATRERSD